MCTDVSESLCVSFRTYVSVKMSVSESMRTCVCECVRMYVNV